MISAKAKEIAAKKIGLRPDQIERAVTEYRAAVEKIEVEPEWKAIWHMCGSREAMHQYCAEGTKVALQINSWKGRSGWEQEKCYTLDGNSYETFSEARAIELEREARPSPYGLGREP